MIELTVLIVTIATAAAILRGTKKQTSCSAEQLVWLVPLGDGYYWAMPRGNTIPVRALPPEGFIGFDRAIPKEGDTLSPRGLPPEGFEPRCRN